MIRDKVIFVDDEKICHLFADIVLSNQCNYTLLSAYNGKEAIKLIDLYHEHLALIISDIILPDISGYDIYDYLCSNESCKDIGFLLQTGLSKTDLPIKEKNLNIPILHKPYSHKELLAAVTNFKYPFGYCDKKNR